ncbi:MAG TPA: NAD(P)-dependent oxidoreductase [Anaerolineales bacterium]|nr:NAD(P)-dependent oxidoreductase [Anaerolineales bacterium]
MILITGGLGFVGSNVARAVREVGEDCILTVHNHARVPGFLKDHIGKHIFLERADVADLNTLLGLGKKYPITGIVHLVTGGAPSGTSIPELAEDLRATVTSIANVLQAAREWNVKRVSIAGAPVEYNGVRTLPWREDQPLPLTAAYPIEAAKKCAEIVSSYLSLRNQIECIEMRFSSMYGPNYDPGRRMLAGRLVHAAVKGIKPDLEAIRFSSVYAADSGDQCYIRDAGRAVALLQTAAKLNYSVYNIASGHPTSNQEMVDAIRKVMPEFEVELPAGHMPGAPDPIWYMDIARLHADTGFQPQFDIAAGVADYIAWLQAGNER